MPIDALPSEILGIIGTFAPGLHLTCKCMHSDTPNHMRFMYVSQYSDTLSGVRWAIQNGMSAHLGAAAAHASRDVLDELCRTFGETEVANGVKQLQRRLTSSRANAGNVWTLLAVMTGGVWSDEFVGSAPLKTHMASIVCASRQHFPIAAAMLYRGYGGALLKWVAQTSNSRIISHLIETYPDELARTVEREEMGWIVGADCMFGYRNWLFTKAFELKLVHTVACIYAYAVDEVDVQLMFAIGLREHGAQAMRARAGETGNTPALSLLRLWWDERSDDFIRQNS